MFPLQHIVIHLDVINYAYPNHYIIITSFSNMPVTQIATYRRIIVATKDLSVKFTPTKSPKSPSCDLHNCPILIYFLCYQEVRFFAVFWC